jgi:putative intracellular protease/amidase
MAAKPLKIGVFMPSPTQVLDMACVDIFAMQDPSYLSLLPILPKHLLSIAPTIHLYYITTPENYTASSIPMTANLTIKPTHSTEHAEVQPGQLDVLLVPGPDPRLTWGEEVLRFLREHAKKEETDILSVCTGILLCAEAGIIEGKTVCGPRGMQDELKKRHPSAKFVGEKYRWIQDGNLWTSGMFYHRFFLIFFVFFFFFFFIRAFQLGCSFQHGITC